MNSASISFGKSRKNDYTAYQQRIMKDMKKAAIDNNWIDIYTGDTFSRENMPTIEHVIPHCMKSSAEIKQRAQKGFQIDGLDNIFPVGSSGNSLRSNESFAKSIIKEPAILDRLLNELEKYKKYNSEVINGEDWVKRLLSTLTEQLQGLTSDVQTRLLKQVN